MRRRRRYERENRSDNTRHSRDRWMVSYADFITLLFALFVIMYAVSTLNEGKYRVLSDGLLAAFRHERAAATSPAAFPTIVQPPLVVQRPQSKSVPDPRERQEQKLRDIAQRIAEAINPLVQSGQVHMRETARGLAVEINASVLFAPGQAQLQPDSIAALQQVIDVLRRVDNSIEVEGHTDKRPIATSQFPSNWELSSARASAVIRLFVATGLPAERLVAVGYADNRPVEPGDTSEAMARNRRVTLLILSDAGVAPATPIAAAAADSVAR